MIQRVDRQHRQRILSRNQQLGYIAKEGQISSLMAHHRPPVQEDLGDLIHRAEVQQDMLSLGDKVLGQGEGRLISHGVAQFTLVPAEQALRAKGERDGIVVQLPAVQQGQEGIAPHLRTGVSGVPGHMRHLMEVLSSL